MPRRGSTPTDVRLDARSDCKSSNENDGARSSVRVTDPASNEAKNRGPSARVPRTRRSLLSRRQSHWGATPPSGCAPSTDVAGARSPGVLAPQGRTSARTDWTTGPNANKMVSTVAQAATGPGDRRRSIHSESLYERSSQQLVPSKPSSKRARGRFWAYSIDPLRTRLRRRG